MLPLVDPLEGCHSTLAPSGARVGLKSIVQIKPIKFVETIRGHTMEAAFWRQSPEGRLLCPAEVAAQWHLFPASLTLEAHFSLPYFPSPEKKIVPQGDSIHKRSPMPERKLHRSCSAKWTAQGLPCTSNRQRQIICQKSRPVIGKATGKRPPSFSMGGITLVHLLHGHA